MKKLLTGMTLVATMAIVGCSTNTQNQNTALGALGGAAIGGAGIGLAGGNAVAIGAGIVGGALIGGFLGHSMDSTDNASSNAAMQSNSTNQTRSWVNSRTGTAYTMTPTSDSFAHKGYANCRHFHFTATYKSGKTHQYDGTACLMSDGHWRSVK